MILKENEENYKDLRNNLSSYKNIFQYAYSNVFTEIYCSTERRGFDLKSNFYIISKSYKDKKELKISLGKNPENYEVIRNGTSVSEQKHMKVNGFNEIEGKEDKERVKKRKQKRQKVAQSNKQLKKRKSKKSLKKKRKNCENV